jgi:hypothetical protein
MFFFPSQKKNQRAGPASTYERSELVTWYVNSAGHARVWLSAGSNIPDLGRGP